MTRNSHKLLYAGALEGQSICQSIVPSIKCNSPLQAKTLGNRPIMKMLKSFMYYNVIRHFLARMQKKVKVVDSFNVPASNVTVLFEQKH